MTQDEFVRLMVESGLARYVQVEKTCVSNALQRFAALAAAHEREKQAEQEPVEAQCDHKFVIESVNAPNLFGQVYLTCRINGNSHEGAMSAANEAVKEHGDDAVPKHDLTLIVDQIARG